MDTSREVLQYLHYNPQSSREDIARGILFGGSEASLKRIIAMLVKAGDVIVEGKARATRYALSPQAHLLMPLDLDTYFSKDIDDRQVQSSFNFQLINEQLPKVELFTNDELALLSSLQNEFKHRSNEQYQFAVKEYF